MFGHSSCSRPQLPERTSLQQAQGAAKPAHVAGESAEEMSNHFDHCSSGAPHRASASSPRDGSRLELDSPSR